MDHLSYYRTDTISRNLQKHLRVTFSRFRMAKYLLQTRTAFDSKQHSYSIFDKSDVRKRSFEIDFLRGPWGSFLRRLGSVETSALPSPTVSMAPLLAQL